MNKMLIIWYYDAVVDPAIRLIMSVDGHEDVDGL